MRSRSNAISEPTLFLSAAEQRMLVNAKGEGIARGITLISKMTTDIESLIWSGVSSATGIVASNLSYGYSDTPGQTAMERVSTSVDEMAFGLASNAASTAAGKIARLLGKCWEAAAKKIMQNPWVDRLMKMLKIGAQFLLAWLKKAVLNAEVIGKLVPFYGAARALIDSAVGIVNVKGHFDAIDRIQAVSPSIGGGVPTVALGAFKSYAQQEAALTATKTAYTFAKGLTSVLLQIFTLGASSVFDFVASIVEAVVGFAYSCFQGLVFKRATDKFRSYVEADTIPDAFDFATVCTGAPFIGAIFFGAANYIGHMNLTAMLSNGNRVLSASSLAKSVADVSETQRAACQYVSSAHFDFKFRTTEDELKHGWIVDMMKGFASDGYRSQFVTENASFSTRFKHNGRRLGRKLKKGLAWVYNATG